MRRLGRSLLNALSILSLLLLVAMTVWWIRSRWVSDWLTWESVRPWHAEFKERDHISVITLPGSLSFQKSRMAGPIVNDGPFMWTRAAASLWHQSGASPRLTIWGKLGFGFYHGRSPEPTLDEARASAAHLEYHVWNQSVIAVPFWLLCLVFGLLPAKQLMLIQKRKLGPVAPAIPNQGNTWQSIRR
jgi:hypothetical protein